MGNLFEVIDPLGRTIICEAEQWNNHILPSHPEMYDKIRGIESTVSNPDIIFKSDTHDDRYVYFQAYSSTGLNTKVLVDVSSEPGYIITAFLQKGIRGNIDKGDIKYVKTNFP